MPTKTRLSKKAEKALFDLVQAEVITKRESFKLALKYLAKKQKVGNKIKIHTDVFETSKIDRGIDIALGTIPTADIGQLIQTMKNNDQTYYDITKSKVYHRLQHKVERGLVDKVKVDGSSKVLYAKRHIPINDK